MRTDYGNMTIQNFRPVYKHDRLDVVDEVAEGDTFDVWAKRWSPETDTFEWRRFTDCRWDWRGKNSRPRLIDPKDDYTFETWRAVYWLVIPKPPEAK